MYIGVLAYELRKLCQRKICHPIFHLEILCELSVFTLSGNIRAVYGYCCVKSISESCGINIQFIVISVIYNLRGYDSFYIILAQEIALSMEACLI